MRISKLLSLALALGGLLALAPSASAQRVVVSPPHVRVVVPIAPPAPLVVVVPAAPYPGAVWSDGYYRWDGHRHARRDGRWHHGRAGFHRAPRAWSHSGGGWVRVPGGWVRD